MNEDTLTKSTKYVLESLNQSGLVKDFYLAGGSALALYCGHRFSVDLDWFAESFSYTSVFREKLSELGKLSVESEGEHTFNGALDGVKISFFEYPYPLISAKTRYKENTYLAGRPDIAVMKLETVARRGTYKDFVDLFFLLKEYELGQLLSFLKEKFAGVDYNETHLLKSITYFEDAEKSEFPEMIEEVSWDEIKKVLISEA